MEGRNAAARGGRLTCVQRTGFTQHFREELLTTTGVLALRVLWITKLGCFLRPPRTRLGLEGGKSIWPPSWGYVIRWAPCDSVSVLSRVKTCNILRVWSAAIDSQAPFSAKHSCVEVEHEHIFACHRHNRFPSSFFCQERLCEDPLVSDVCSCRLFDTRLQETVALATCR